jgi:hypothetical protein
MRNYSFINSYQARLHTGNRARIEYDAKLGLMRLVPVTTFEEHLERWAARRRRRLLIALAIGIVGGLVLGAVLVAWAAGIWS